ncbi:unnamed protein product [Microthlaspi erraticum]|uniref:Uncharacterized protein n=1 Tax=Microthlaspi erraticum TaxID=1685480 RepID=A0A6D2JN42_9BRAS|nr:unnamed protein product [Microthlaspi erraticum]
MRDESKADDDDERKKVYPKAERYVDKADETGKPIVALSEAACSLSRYRNDEGWQRIINAKRVFPEVKRRYVDPKEKPIVALSIAAFSRAAAEINPVDLSTFIEKLRADCWLSPEEQTLRFMAYYTEKLSQVSIPWMKMFNESSVSTLIEVPLSHIPTCVYQKSVDWMNKLPLVSLTGLVRFALTRIHADWVAQDNFSISEEAIFIGLAMVLRSNPHALTPPFLAMLRESPMYQGEDKLGLIVWIVAQASKGDIGCGLYSWAHVLLPLVHNYKSCSLQSMDLILQFVEIILSNPEATILVNRPSREGERLIPASSFEILDTKRFEAVYPLLKEVALAPESGENAVGQIFNFSLKLAGEEGNPGLAKEAAAIAIRCVTENLDCFKEWDILYEEHLEASVALLRELVDQSPELSSSPYHAHTVNRTLKSFRLKNEKYWSLHKEADKSCKLISGRLSPPSGSGIKQAALLVLASASGAAALTLFLLCF